MTEHLPKDLAEAIRQGRCVLFLGSAVHAPPPPELDQFRYPQEQRPPVGSALSKRLAEYSHYSDAFPDEDIENLMRVSLYIDTEAQYGRFGLVHQLKDILRGDGETRKRPSSAVRMLAELPFPIVVTTNYDLLFDEALRDAGKEPHVAVYSSDEGGAYLDDPTVEEPLLFKMHGDIDHPDSIVISDEDYIGFVERMSEKSGPVPETVRYFMKRWHTVFVGYSLRDYNLRLFLRMLRAGLDQSQKPNAFSVDLYPDVLVKKVWEDKRGLVAFLVEDIWEWIPNVYETIKGHSYGGDDA